MKRVEKVLAGFEDNADVVSGYLKDLPASAWRERDGRWGWGRPSTSLQADGKSWKQPRTHGCIVRETR